MTDVEKIKTYLSIEDAQEQRYYLKEIMPISPKDKISICDTLIRNNDLSEKDIRRLLISVLGSQNPLDDPDNFRRYWDLLLFLIHKGSADAMAEAIPICGLIDDKRKKRFWNEHGYNKEFDAYNPYASEQLRDFCVNGIVNSTNWRAIYEVAQYYRKENYGLPEDKRKALELYKKAERLYSQQCKPGQSRYPYYAAIGNLSAEFGDAPTAMWAYRRDQYVHSDGSVYMFSGGDEGELHDAAMNIRDIVFGAEDGIESPFMRYVVTAEDIVTARRAAECIDKQEDFDWLKSAIHHFETQNGAFTAENVMRYKRGKLAVKDAQEQQRQECLRKIERTERNLQMLDGCFGSFVLLVGVPVALTIFAIWFVISHF